MPHPRYRAVLFDLDGTLIDTAPDLGYSLNEMRRRRALESLSGDAIRAQASHGSRGLIEIGFGIRPEDREYEALRREFLEIYAQTLTASSILFPGMNGVLEALERQGIAWGVVTNKPARFTEPLLDHLGLMARAACVVSGDTCAQPKPHPEPMWHACRTVQVEPERCLYVGDARRDVEAAIAAGMPSLVALYGYLAATDQPRSWGAGGYIERPDDLLDYLHA